MAPRYHTHCSRHQSSLAAKLEEELLAFIFSFKNRTGKAHQISGRYRSLSMWKKNFSKALWKGKGDLHKVCVKVMQLSILRAQVSHPFSSKWSISSTLSILSKLEWKFTSLVTLWKVASRSWIKTLGSIFSLKNRRPGKLLKLGRKYTSFCITFLSMFLFPFTRMDQLGATLKETAFVISFSFKLV